jgi:hypothetical protein
MVGHTHRIGPSVIDITSAFATVEACLTYLEAARWPNGVRCLKCLGERVNKYVLKGRAKRVKGELTGERGPDRHVYQCLNKECLHQFTATDGTIFNDTHLPLNKWFLAVALMVNAKKGISAKQMERDLGVSYKTAWYLCHRIRKAMDDGTGLFTGTVEIDETYIGGKYDRRGGRAKYDKQPVFGALERGGEGQVSQVRAFPIPVSSTTVITGAVRGTVSVKADLLISDEARSHKRLSEDYRHEQINHINLEYVRKDNPAIHTNSIEGFWSLFKRGLIGSFHKVSVKHLHRYLNEFQFRFNNRREEDIFAAVIINMVIAAGIEYKQLTAKVSEGGEPV